MSSFSSTNFITSFDTLVKKEYQEGSKLLNAVRVKKGVNGSTHRFHKINKGVATPVITQADITPMNVVHGYADAVLTDYVAADYSSIYDLAALSFDERRELVDTAKMAIGRRIDQMIINAVNASAFGTTVDVNVGGSNTGLNLAKILRAKRLLDDNGVPMEGRTIACSARAIEQGLSEASVTSADYNVLMPLMKGEITSFSGFNFVFIESRDEGGIPLATNTRTNFAFHRDAVGLAIGIDVRTEVNYIPEKLSWLITAAVKSGATTIDTDGVIKLQTYES